MEDLNLAGAAEGDAPIQWPFAATLVLYAETALQRKWAVSSAISLVRSLVGQQNKVVFADLHVGASPVADELGFESGPGIVDVLFRGTSFSVVARRPQEESFYFLTIGTNPPPSQVIYTHPQWKKIAERLPQTRAHLLPCVPWAEWKEYGPIPGFEACIVLNAVGADVTLPAGVRKLAEYTAPPKVRNPAGEPAPIPDFLSNEPVVEDVAGSEPPADRLAAEPSLEPSEPAVDSPSSAEPEPPESDYQELTPDEAAPEPRVRVGSGVEPRSPVGIGRSVGSARIVEESPDFSSQAADPFIPKSYGSARGGGSFVSRYWPIGVTALILGVVGVVVWQLVAGEGAPAEDEPVTAAAEATQPASSEEARPESDPSDDAVATGGPEQDVRAPGEEEGADPASGRPPPEETAPAAAPAEAERPAESPLAFSVVIASFSSFDDAISRRDRWMKPGTPFYVAPTIVRGVVYYRVFAGMLPDRETADRLQNQLVEEGVKEAAGAWDIRPTRLAFHFGIYESLREAESAIETLQGKRIPAYVVRAAAPAGGEAYHVYAGGYENTDQARPLREQIASAGVEAELVERLGLLTP